MGHPLPEPQQVSHEEADSAGGRGRADPAESVSDNGMNFVMVKRDVQVSVNEHVRRPGPGAGTDRGDRGQDLNGAGRARP